MNLENKRRVIEVLLCAAGEWASVIPVVAYEIGTMPGDAMFQRHRAARDYDALRPPRFITYTEECVEAAYRLIETSPTLRREWFGAR